MKVGDFVKGISTNMYSITDKKMKKAVVLSVYDDLMEIKILQHEAGNIGKFHVEQKYFEVIGEVKAFDREELLKRMADGEKEAIFDYNLREADLREADLREANLRGADLRGANLCEADLCGADLREADLRGADLCGADLCGADLRGANLCEANLRGADLRGANLCEADLCEANLRGANLCEADLCGADLRGADLDFSCLPLWCGSLLAKMDDRQVKQLLYHTLSIVKNSDNVSQEIKDKLLTEANIEVAKEFHMSSECNKL